jgi:two-component system, chemotaxis family, chemotaxis protein CheY
MATILVTDDASFMRKSLKYIVESVGHNVVGMAEDGQEALELFNKLKPDIVTLDLLMTGKDGFWALKNIIKADPKARIIMVTAVGNEDRQEEAQKIGALGYIRKPFKPSEIIKEITKVLELKTG